MCDSKRGYPRLPSIKIPPPATAEVYIYQASTFQMKIRRLCSWKLSVGIFIQQLQNNLYLQVWEEASQQERQRTKFKVILWSSFMFSQVPWCNKGYKLLKHCLMELFFTCTARFPAFSHSSFDILSTAQEVMVAVAAELAEIIQTSK